MYCHHSALLSNRWNTTYAGVGALPIYTEAYSWLDASLRYQFSRKIIFALEGMNLLQTQRESFYSRTRPQGAWINNRLISAAVTVQL